jgi:hypothetical protein
MIPRLPFPVALLLFLMAILSLGGLYTGMSLMLEPSGSHMNLPADLFPDKPFDGYALEGLALFVVFGLVPGLLLYPLLTKPHWKKARKLSIYSRRYWAWACALYLAVFLIAANDVVTFISGYRNGLQSVVSAFGVILLVTVLLPGVQKHYRRRGSHDPDFGKAKADEPYSDSDAGA